MPSTPIKRPSKRQHTELKEEEEEDENPLEGSSVDITEPHDSTYDPADTLTESANVTSYLIFQLKHFINLCYIPLLIVALLGLPLTNFLSMCCVYCRMESSIPVHKTPTDIVYEKCLMELFQVCPVCKRECDMQTRRLGTFLSVEQQCLHCEFSRGWNSQPFVGSTPAGNLQLSTAVYATGASFFKLEKVLYLDLTIIK